MPVDIQRAVTRRFWNLHRFVYRRSGGRVGQRLFAPKGLAALLLTTVGHRSGRTRSTPLFYLEDGERLVVVASNLGSDRDPAWWRNLQTNPEAEVLLGTIRRRVHAPSHRRRASRLLAPLRRRLPGLRGVRTAHQSPDPGRRP